MIRAIADTHAVIWYRHDDPRLSTTARTLIEDAANADDEIGVSAITIVEMVYPIERGRIDATLDRLITD